MSEEEKMLIHELRMHLRIARAMNYAPLKMSFVDGLMYALNKISGKDYGYSNQDVFLYGPHGERIVSETAL